MENCMLFQDWFSKEDCNHIVTESEKLLDIKDATTGEGSEQKVTKHRKGNVAFITTANPDHMPLWNFIAPRF